jgi:hypothetical protein
MFFLLVVITLMVCLHDELVVLWILTFYRDFFGLTNFCLEKFEILMLFKLITISMKIWAIKQDHNHEFRPNLLWHNMLLEPLTYYKPWTTYFWTYAQEFETYIQLHDPWRFFEILGGIEFAKHQLTEIWVQAHVVTLNASCVAIITNRIVTTLCTTTIWCTWIDRKTRPRINWITTTLAWCTCIART